MMLPNVPLDHLDDNDRARVEKWDWASINALDMTARQKCRDLPACRVCGGVLWLSQPGAHFSCDPTLS